MENTFHLSFIIGSIEVWGTVLSQHGVAGLPLLIVELFGQSIIPQPIEKVQRPTVAQ